MLRYFYIVGLLILPVICSAQDQFEPYFGQTAPGNIPEVFAPGIISLPNREEKVISFSPEGKEIFFVMNPYPNCRIMHMEYKNGNWTAPETVSFSINRLCDEPFFSSDGKRVYFYTGINGAENICYSEKNDTLWGSPVNLGSPLNLPQGQYHPCIVADSSIYFSSSDGKICRSQYLNGQYQSRVIYPYPVNYADIGSNWEDPYVSPDESYLILHSTRRGGFGGSDIYISYKKTDGSWTNPKNLGGNINTAGNDWDGDITHDGKYMTFVRNGDLYWVSSGFIDSLRHTNFIPYLKSGITNKSDTLGQSLSYTFPDSTFIDDDGNNTLTYSASLNDGNSLPSWLSFNPSSRTLSGKPEQSGVYNIKITAIDTAGAGVSCTFKITVISVTGVEEKIDQYPAGFMLYQNYPNPFNPATIINYSLNKPSFVLLSIYNPLGQRIKTLTNSFQNEGVYSVVWNGTDDIDNSVGSGIYFYKLESNGMDILKKMVLIR